MKLHELKCAVEFYDAVASGLKPFELRRDDRGFDTGDMLWLREYGPDVAAMPRDCFPGVRPLIDADGYTGASTLRVITYVLRDFPHLADGYVVLGLRLPLANAATCQCGIAFESDSHAVVESWSLQHVAALGGDGHYITMWP